MGVLSESDIERFRADGFIVDRGDVTGERLAALRAELAGWVEQSRGHAVNYGDTLDGRARFDLEIGHSAAAPRLRRVNNPAEISISYRAVTHESRLPDAVADLIGPDVKFHHCKINLKLPGSETRVGYHQDFSYTPHTNDDLVTALLMLDDMTLENGCLMVVPGSHREGQVSLWQGQTFTGETPPRLTAAFEKRAVPVTGKAGDVCLMHTSLMHGSAPNRSRRARGLFITVYAAADAFALSPSPLPNAFEGDIVRGKASRIARLQGRVVELPATYDNASFFEVQGQKSATTKG
ncbi:MAG: phytanoyl-CoA dioxygenase family protein [Alphaproteobacteria bacterium]